VFVEGQRVVNRDSQSSNAARWAHTDAAKVDYAHGTRSSIVITSNDNNGFSIVWVHQQTVEIKVAIAEYLCPECKMPMTSQAAVS